MKSTSSASLSDEGDSSVPISDLLSEALNSSEHGKKKIVGMLKAELAMVGVLQNKSKMKSLALSIFSPHTFIYIITPITLLLVLVYMFLATSYELAKDQETCLTSWIPMYQQVSMPRTDCSFCANVTEAKRISNLSREEFFTKYAYSGVPIVVTDATDNWRARDKFSYDFFKRMYFRNPQSLVSDGDEGQFFAYRSDIENLFQFFNLSEERSSLEGGKSWYIGWSTQNPVIGQKLKKYFSIPYFIHPQSGNQEGLKVSWIFMGAPGPGAFMHIDEVMYSSWQAQLQGVKTWTLAPQPECEQVCSSFDVTVNTGDMIVVNTNMWYHSTYIHPGNISITIGNEFE